MRGKSWGRSRIGKGPAVAERAGCRSTRRQVNDVASVSPVFKETLFFQPFLGYRCIESMSKMSIKCPCRKEAQ